MKTTPSVIIRIVIWLFLLIGGGILSVYFDLLYFKNLFFFPVFHIFTFVLGVLVIKLSFHAAAIGGRELNKKGRTGNIPRMETNRLVTSGIYSCTRHPMLFGLMLLPLGVALLIGSVTYILVTAPVEAVVIFVLMIIFDEKEAEYKFGEEYRKYREKTQVFPKNKECWKKLFFK